MSFAVLLFFGSIAIAWQYYFIQKLQKTFVYLLFTDEISFMFHFLLSIKNSYTRFSFTAVLTLFSFIKFFMTTLTHISHRIRIFCK